MPGYAHQIVVNAPAAKFFDAIDFGTGRKIDGPATAVGTSRTIPLGKGADAPKIVEMQVAREVTATRMSYAYTITNEDSSNPFLVKGYRADVVVYSDSTDEGRCFCTWIANWDEANEAIAALPGMILGGMKQGEKVASGKSRL
jgi:hypothetical protein